MTTPAYLADTDSAAFSSAKSLALFWRLDLPVVAGVDQTLRLWTGLNNCPIGIPAIDPQGTRYFGAGRLENIPQVEILINGKSGRFDFTLSGVPPDIVSRLDETAPEVKGRDVHLGAAPLDGYWQPLTPILPLWFGIADFWWAKVDAAKNPQVAAMATIGLSTGSGQTGRSRPLLTAFTDEVQKRLYPDDQGFSRVTRYESTYIVAWPKF